MVKPLVHAVNLPVLDMTALPPAIPLDMGPGRTGGLVASTAILLAGWSVRETSGSAVAALRLTNALDGSGQRVAELGVGAGLSAHFYAGPPFILCKNGLYATVTTGAVHGIIYAIPLAPGA